MLESTVLEGTVLSEAVVDSAVIERTMLGGDRAGLGGAEQDSTVPEPTILE